MYHQLSELYTLASGYGRRAAQSIIGLWIGWEEDRIERGRVYIHDFLGCVVAREYLSTCVIKRTHLELISRRDIKKGLLFRLPKMTTTTSGCEKIYPRDSSSPWEKKRDSFLAMPDPDKTLLVCVQEGMKKNPDLFIANAVGYALHQCYGSGFDYCLFDTGTENGGQMVNPNRKT